MAKKAGRLIGHIACQSCGEQAEVREPAEKKEGRPSKASTYCFNCDTQAFCKSVTADHALRSRMTPVPGKAEPKKTEIENEEGGDGSEENFEDW